MVSYDFEAGRALDPNARGEVVVNQVVPGAENWSVGEEIVLSVDGRDRSLLLVGKVREVGTGAVAYVSPRTFTDLAGHNRGSLLRIEKADGVSLAAATSVIDRVLLAERAPVSYVTPLAVFENAVAAHFEILVRSLLALAMLTALVGSMGLASALSANVSEATRELAVLRAVGANGRQIAGLVTRESLVVSLGSFIVAVGLGLGLSLVIGRVIGMMSFRLPLPLAPQLPAMALLFVVLLGLGALASLLPARRASRLTVSDALRVL